MHSRLSNDTRNSPFNRVTKSKGHRIISVGNSTRKYETIQRDHDKFVETSGWTNIFIYPGFDFKAIDGHIMNFRLPKSTLVMLVSAFKVVVKMF